jgi:hypothetical protein
MATNQIDQILEMINAGATPEQIMAQRADAKALAFAQLSPEQQVSYNVGRGFGDLGKAVGSLFGAAAPVDPMLQQASKIRGLAAEFDTSTAEGMMQYAKALQSVNPALAQQAAMKAREMKLTEAARARETALTESRLETERARQGQISAQEQRAIAEAESKKAQTDKAARFEEAINALPPTATDAEVEATIRKFGKPDDVLKAVARRQEAEAKRQAALELSREKASLEAAQKERDAAFRRELAAATAANRSALTGVQQQIAQQRLEDLKEKAAERKDKKEDSKQAALSHANKVLGDVAETNTLVKPATTGILGKPTSFIPGTDAYNLNQRLLTIKANLGFDRLQQMRDASPTGGALGQVAVQELQALQATVGSLDIGQDDKELAKNLRKIEHHYSNWIRTTRGEQPISFEEFQKSKQPAPQAPQAPAGGWSIKPKQ